MENSFNIPKTKKIISKSKDVKKYKINKSMLKQKIKNLDSSFDNNNKNVISNIMLNNDSKFNIELNTNYLSSIFNYNFENSIYPPQLGEEQILNFKHFSNSYLNYNEQEINTSHTKSEKISSLTQQDSKYLINNVHQSIYGTVDIIIKIQSHFRGYLVKKNLLKKYLNRNYITKKSIHKIIYIQKIVRSFLTKINIRKKLIAELINKKRKNSIELIIRKMKFFVSIIKLKKNIVIEHCLEQRKLKVIYLQQSFRNYLFFKSFQKLKNDIDKNYFLDYPFEAKKVDILLYPNDDSINKKKNKKFSFKFNKLLNYFILLINPNNIFSGKYKCQFVVNDIIICDNRYPTIKRKNQIFNIIYLIPKNKKVIYKVISNGKIENNIKLYSSDNTDNIEENNKEKISMHNLKKSLEDIVEEDDEGISVTSSRENKIEKALNDFSDKSLKMSKKDESENDNYNENDDDDENDNLAMVYKKYIKSKNKK